MVANVEETAEVSYKGFSDAMDGSKLRAWREGQGWTRETTAGWLQITTRSYNGYEKPGVKVPRWVYLATKANVYYRRAEAFREVLDRIAYGQARDPQAEALDILAREGGE